MSDPIAAVIFLALVLGTCAVSCLARAALSMNRYDIKQRARSGDKAAKLFYSLCFANNKLAATLLLLKSAFQIAMVGFLVAFLDMGILSLIMSGLVLLISSELIPLIYLRQYGLPLNRPLAVLLQKTVTTLTPVSKPLVWILDHWYEEQTPIIHSREELLAIFNETKLSEDTSIAKQELEIVKSALSFGDKTVREVMTPLRAVKVVYESDIVGPVLMDELHASGFSRFPVLAGKSDKRLSGTLFIRDLISRNHKGTVHDVMSKDLFYVHEEQPLAHALQAFIRTKHHLFIVVNTFEEYVGIITIEDIVEQVIGKQIIDEFDKYDNIREVATLHAEREHKKRSSREVSSTTPEEVV